MIEYDYDVFGKTYVRTGSGDLVSIENYRGELYDNSRLYTGREYDKEIDLYYLRARYYDTNLGRFISRDPIGQLYDVNLYAYVKNNPIGFIDLLGLAAKEFVAVYDRYNDLKDLIYNFGTVDPIFLLLPKEQRIELLTNYYSAEREAKELHYSRNDYNKDVPDNLADLNTEEGVKLGIFKSLYHQETTNVLHMNVKYVSNDGFSEVVYYNDGNLVTHELDVGTYNFFSPINDESKHYDYDVLPYYEWGNGENYNTSLVDKFIPF